MLDSSSVPNDPVASGIPRPFSEAYAWDWSATTHPARDGVVNELIETLGAARGRLGDLRVQTAKGKQGWSRGLVAFDAGGYKVGTVFFGGGRDDVHVESSSSQAHASRLAVAALPDARTARVDTCVNTLIPYDELASICEGLAGPRTKVTEWSSRIGGESTGRTLYIGAPTSDVRVRLYEKWLESPGQYVDGTNRLEVQLRPPSRSKGAVSSWTPAETFCASKLTRRLAAELDYDLANPGSLQKSKGTPDLESSIEWMGAQYGGTVRKWLDHSGGDLGRMLDYLEV